MALGVMRFKIEYIAQSAAPAYILARQLDLGDFRLSDSSRLGGMRLKPQLSMPRSLGSDGKPDMTVFAFLPVAAGDLESVKVGQTVELEQ